MKKISKQFFKHGKGDSSPQATAPITTGITTTTTTLSPDLLHGSAPRDSGFPVHQDWHLESCRQMRIAPDNLLIIFSFLRARELFSCMRVSKEFYLVANNEQLLRAAELEAEIELIHFDDKTCASGLEFSEDKLTVKNRVYDFRTVLGSRCFRRRNCDQYYFEATIVDNNIPLVDGIGVGVCCKFEKELKCSLRNYGTSCVLHSNQAVWIAGTSFEAGNSRLVFNPGVVIGILVDFDEKKIEFWNEGTCIASVKTLPEKFWESNAIYPVATTYKSGETIRFDFVSASRNRTQMRAKLAPPTEPQQQNSKSKY